MATASAGDHPERSGGSRRPADGAVRSRDDGGRTSKPPRGRQQQPPERARAGRAGGTAGSRSAHPRRPAVSAVPRLSPTRAPPATAAWKWLARPCTAIAAVCGSAGSAPWANPTCSWWTTVVEPTTRAWNTVAGTSSTLSGGALTPGPRGEPDDLEEGVLGRHVDDAVDGHRTHPGGGPHRDPVHPVRRRGSRRSAGRASSRVRPRRWRSSPGNVAA